VNINSGGQGIFNADIESLADVVVNTGGEATFAAAVNGAIYTHESSTVRFDSTGTQTVAGLINGPAGIVKQGSGVLLLTATNTGFSGGLTITSGTVRAGNANALGTGGPLALNTGGLDLNGNAVTIGLLTGSAGSTVTSSVAGPASLISNATGDSTFAGVISNGAGTVSFEKAGGGTLTLTGAQTYTGDTIISGGGLALDSGASLASTSIKVGETLNGAFLDVTALGNFSLASGQTLGGHGDVYGDVTIANGAILSPGGSVGLLFNLGDMTWGGGGQFLFEIFNAEGGPLSDWDWLNVTGNLNITSSPETPFVINLQTLADPNDSTAGLMPEDNWNDTTDYAWLFVTTGTTISPFSTNLFTVNTANFQNPYGGTFSVKRGDQVTGGTDSELYIVYAAIPEPGTLVLAGIGLAAAGWHLRRRRRK
jgi:autotransporter-associated beta strand protein